MTSEKEMEQGMQQIYMEMQVLDQNMKKLHQNLEMLNAQAAEMRSNVQGVEEFKNSQSGSETFMQLATGVFAKAQLKDTQNLLVNVGAGIAVEKDVNSTMELMNKQLEEMESVENQLNAQLQKFMARGQELEKKARAMVAEQENDPKD